MNDDPDIDGNLPIGCGCLIAVFVAVATWGAMGYLAWRIFR